MKKIKFTLVIVVAVVCMATIAASVDVVSSSESDKNAISTWTVAYSSSSFTHAANELVVVVIALDNIGTTTDGDKGDVTGVSDNAGNTYTKAIEFSNVQTGAGTGATASIWYCQLTNSIIFSNTLTINFNGSVTAKARQAYGFTVASGSTIGKVTGSGLANDAADPGSITLSGLPSREYLFFRVTALEEASGATWTNTAGYTRLYNTAQGTTGGGAASNMSMGVEYKIVTATSETSDPTGNAVDCASAMTGFYEVTSGGATNKPKFLINTHP